MVFRDSAYTRHVGQYTSRSEWIRTLLIAAVLAIASIFSPRGGILILVLIVASLVTRQVYKLYRGKQRSEELLNSNRDIRAPDPLAEQRVSLSPEPYLIVGSAIETLVHSTLNTKADYSDLGWKPEQVQIIDTKRTIDPSSILARIPNGLLPLKENESNDIKFVLANHSHPFKDNEGDLTLSFARTDWQTHKTVRNLVNGIETDDNLAMEFGSLDVEGNRVPSSVALHYIVRFNDDAVLLLKRAPHIAHEANRWSISGEEQFKVVDFGDGTLERVFRRALCEEVVGLFDGNAGSLETRWSNHVADKITSMRLWGLLFEEHACVTSLLGFYQLGISRKEFVQWHKQLIDCSVGTRDNEGVLYSTTTDELELMLKVGMCRAWPLFQYSSLPISIQSGQLARTSRYRAYRLVRAIKGDLPAIGPRGISILRVG